MGIIKPRCLFTRLLEITISPSLKTQAEQYSRGEWGGVGHMDEWAINSYIKYSKAISSPSMSYDHNDPPRTPHEIS